MAKVLDTLTSSTISISTLNSLSSRNSNNLTRENVHPRMQGLAREDNAAGSNPFKNVDEEKKAILMMLHVVFPPPLLLQALDLLDRGGVVRIVWEIDREEGGEAAGKGRDGEGGNADGKRVGKEDERGELKDGDRGIRGVDGDMDGEREIGEKEETEETPEDRYMITEAISEKDQARLNIIKPSPNTNISPNTTVKPAQTHQLSSSTHQTPQAKSNRNPNPRTRITMHQVYPTHSNAHTHTSSKSSRAAVHSRSDDPYIVHLNAWNCSCAAFTYAAFPVASTSDYGHEPWGRVAGDGEEGDGSGFAPWDLGLHSNLASGPANSESSSNPDSKSYNYGGFSHLPHGQNSQEESLPPICKHLLACLLSERWGDVLGSFVHERRVVREEMGGCVL